MSRRKKAENNGDGHPAAEARSRLTIGGNALVGTTETQGRLDAALEAESAEWHDRVDAARDEGIIGPEPSMEAALVEHQAEAHAGLAARVAELEARLATEAEWRLSVERATKRVDAFSSAMVAAKERAKEATENWRASVSDLTVITRSWRQSEEVASRPVIAAIEARQEQALAGAKAAEVPAEDAWRLAPIAALAISPSLREKLDDAGFKTLGHLADWSRDNDGFNGIPGVGEKKRETLAEAFADYFSEHGVGDFAVIEEDPETLFTAESDEDAAREGVIDGRPASRGEVAEALERDFAGA
jgi:hypothetical protein